MMEYKGNPVSKGIAIGKVYLYKTENRVSGANDITYDSTDSALVAYKQATQAACEELDSIWASMSSSNAPEAAIFKAQKDILLDEAMDEEIQDAIKSEGQSPKDAIESVYTMYAELISQTEDPLIRERSADLYDVCKRLLRCLSGELEQSLAHLSENVIVVTHDLLPSDTATMDRDHVIAIVTEVGGATSHSAVIARSYEIPAVLGIKDICSSLKDGETIVADAINGRILTKLTPDEVSKQEQVVADFRAHLKLEKAFLTAVSETADGSKIEIDLNIGSASEKELSFAPYTDGVGLFRTEFLYMNRSQVPTEDEQFEIYKKVLECFGSKPVTLRTLDAGGDKQVECLSLPKEQNPFLGQRALRFCFVQEDLFLTQLRAALRASVYGNLWLMFPMVGSINDIHKAKAFLEKAKTQLDTRGISYSKDIKVGIMIEIPSLVLLSEEVAQEVDFASLGTNDLTQYLLAADRGEPGVAEYYQMYHPAVFRAIRMVSQAFIKHGKPLCVCGELGGDLLGGYALMGLGLGRLSMGASSIAAMKHVVRGTTLEKARETASEACSASTAEEAEAIIRNAVKSILGE